MQKKKQKDPCPQGKENEALTCTANYVCDACWKIKSVINPKQNIKR